MYVAEQDSFDRFRDVANTFVEDYNDDQVWETVAKTIADTLTEHSDLPTHDEQHPFNRYINEDEVDEQLEEAVRARLDPNNPSLRSVILAFFHDNGSQRDALDDLLEEYFTILEEVMGPVIDDDSTTISLE